MKGPTVWQIGSGDQGRNYAQFFLDHDLMFMGPGRYGPYNEENYRRVVDRGERSGLAIGMVRRFVQRVAPGDVVLLRKGHRVVAIGTVADEEGTGGYAHEDTFGDIYGWDLEHTRRVIWQHQLAKRLAAIQRAGNLFASYKLQPTFTRVPASGTRRISPPG